METRLKALKEKPVAGPENHSSTTEARKGRVGIAVIVAAAPQEHTGPQDLPAETVALAAL